MKKITLSLLLASIFSAHALAATPVGLWRAKQYNPATKNYLNDSDWCFLSDGRVFNGTVGYWATTGFQGVWQKAGDSVFMSGERTNEPEVWWRLVNVVTRTTMVGKGATWVYGSLGSNVNVTMVMTYKGPCSL